MFPKRLSKAITRTMKKSTKILLTLFLPTFRGLLGHFALNRIGPSRLQHPCPAGRASQGAMPSGNQRERYLPR